MTVNEKDVRNERRKALLDAIRPNNEVRLEAARVQEQHHKRVVKKFNQDTSGKSGPIVSITGSTGY